MSIKFRILVIVTVVVAVVGLMSVFIVDEREKALVLRFGQIKQVKTEPGLGFKFPWLDQVVRFEDRILQLETSLIEVTPDDERRLEVDAFVMYRIDDIEKFRQALGAGGEREARIQLNDILDGQIRAVLGAVGVTSEAILSVKRVALMEKIRVAAQSRATDLGLVIVDVRLRQTNLPEQNIDATLQRMIAERERLATEQRANGRKEALIKTADADAEYEKDVSEDRKEAEIIRGEADAERTKILAKAFGADPEFFDFYRSLRAYENSMKAENSTLVISPDHEFLTYLQSSAPRAAK